MPPPVRGYGHQGMNPAFSHLQQSHLHQQQNQHHSQHGPNPGLPPPSLGGHPGFGPGNPSSNINPFSSVNNGLAAGFDGGRLGDGSGTGLASHAAQMGFARGAQMQQQQHHTQHSHDGQLSIDGKPGTAKSRIRDVWRGNLLQEMANLRNLVEKYPYISMDTEFPGIVARPVGSFTTKADYHYQTLRCNVDLLKMIQLGITLFSADGDLPPPTSESTTPAYLNNMIPSPCTWQFNFKFSLSSDMYAQESTSMLQKAGIDFQMHDKNGIDPLEFGALLMTSGLVLLDEVHWISFHSGYDFGYLMKIMLCKELPEDEAEFHKLLNIFFPSLYDIKYLMKHAGRHQSANNTPLTPAASQIIQNLGQKSGLQDIADELGVKRQGTAHQAGSDSLVTGEIYWKMRQIIFNGNIDEKVYSGQIWGLNGQMGYGGGPSHSQTPNLNGAVIYSNGTPSTPNTGHSGLSHTHTPGPHQNHQQQQHGNGGFGGTLTPRGGGGGGGGAFGAFQFNTKP